MVIGPTVEIEGDIVWLDEAYGDGFLPSYEDVEFEDLGFVPVLEAEGETDRLEAVYQEGFLPAEAGP